MSNIELTAKQHNKIKRAIKSLNDVRAELQGQNPENEINWYLEDSNNFNLMAGLPHDDTTACRPLYENVICCYELDEASGGGW